MKPLNLTALKLFCLLALTVILQSCGPGDAGWWKNDEIKAGKRADFHKLNDEAFKYLKANTPKEMEFMLSKELIENNYTKRNIELISNRLNTGDYNLVNEFYVVNKWKSSDTIKVSGPNSYSLCYPGVAREMYIASYLPKDGNNKWMITLVYGKFDYGWKINDLELNPYSINGKTSPQLLQLAQQYYAKGYFSDAATNMESAYNCLRPSFMWRYPDEDALVKFYNTTIHDANAHCKLPLIISQVPTHPQIFRVFNQALPQGTYPAIYYQSTINLNDTTAIRKENNAIKKVIGKVIPGIDVDNAYLQYSAFNARPNVKSSVKHVDMVDKLK